MATQSTVIAAIHATLDAALVLAGGSAIPYGIGAKERAKNARPPRIVWDDSNTGGDINQVRQSNGNPHGLAADVRKWEVVIWGDDRDAAEESFHNLVTAARRTYGRQTIRFGRYAVQPDGSTSKGFVIVADVEVELEITNIIYATPEPTSFSGRGVILPSEEVVIDYSTVAGAFSEEFGMEFD